MDSDIKRLQSTIGDLISIGNSMYDPNTGSMTATVSSQNNQLMDKKTQLAMEIQEQEAVIRRVDRDFADVRDQLPETLPNKSLHVLEDYTLAIVSISYLFMLIIALHTYVLHSSDNFLSALGKGLGYSILLTLISGMILYYMC